ncbi:MAG: oxidoreductase [Nanoarchaeota archaeon]|nr:oxidoreductase [Nanoarchaeota archaeon]
MNKVLDIKDLTDSTYVIYLEKNIDFKPGQYITIGIDGYMREYSLYNSPEENHLELLVKQIQNGKLTTRLRKSIGQELIVMGPLGEFIIEENDLNKPFTFIATGTGISPFRSFVKSYDLDYQVIHGIRYANENYGIESFDSDKHILCVSRGEGKFKGRVTDYIKSIKLNPEGMYYLCGNAEMISEVGEILEEKVPLENIRNEVFF